MNEASPFWSNYYTRTLAENLHSRSLGGGAIWTAVTFLAHLDPLPPAVAAEWHKKGQNWAGVGLPGALSCSHPTALEIFFCPPRTQR